MKLKEQNLLFLTRTMGQGGTENVILQLCEIFQPLVNKVVVCSCGGVNVAVLNKMGIRHYKIPDIAEKNPVTMLLTYRTIKKILMKEKITVIHSHHRMAALYAELAASDKIIKIANAHNTFQDKKRLTKFSYRNTRVVAVGEMVKKNLTDFFEIPEQQVAVIHNAVKPFNGKIEQVDILTKEKESGHILIGNIGRLSEQKGMKYFIEAAEITLQSYPEARFFIVGDGEEKETLQSAVAEKKMTDKVFFMGYRSDIQNVMCQLDFVVLSSLWEGLPLTPIEAFSVGKTIVSTEVDGTPEIVKNEVSGLLCEPHNANDLSEKIIKLIGDEKMRHEMEMNARSEYESDFNFKSLRRNYVRFYESI